MDTAYRTSRFVERRRMTICTDLFVLSQTLTTSVGAVATGYFRSSSEIALISEIFPGLVFVLSAMSTLTAMTSLICVFKCNFFPAAILIAVALHASAGNVVIAYMLTNYFTMDIMSIYFNHTAITVVYSIEFLLIFINALDIIALFFRQICYVRQKALEDLRKLKKSRRSM